MKPAQPPYYPSIRVFDPSEDVTVAEWADTDRVLTTATAFREGRWDTERTPYLHRIMEVLSPQHPAKRVSLCKGTQLGGTEAAVNLIGHRRKHAPTSILVVLPTEKSAANWSKSRIATLFEAFGDEKTRGSDTIWHKDFPGGNIKVAGADSPASLKSNPIEVAILDEVDEFPVSVGTQGCPIALVDARQATYPFKKMFLLSSPTDEDTSRIWKEFQNSNQQYFYVPCPSCDFEQTIDWEDIKYVDDDPSTARWCCRACGVLHDESAKRTWTIENTEWRAHNPGHPNEGFFINTFYSPFETWADCVALWLKAQKDPNLLPNFTNTIRGLPTKARVVSAPSWETLYDRREPYQQGTVPEGVCVLTAAVDVQGDRLEMEVMGWGIGLENWSIDYVVLPGSPYDPTTWDTLADHLARTFPTHDGLEMGISKAVIDSGSYTDEVYKFVRRYAGTGKVDAIKGQDSLRAVVSQRPTRIEDVPGQKSTVRGVLLWNVGSSVIKTQVYGWLDLEPEEDDSGSLIYPPGYCHFPQYDAEYFEMLTAEQQRLTRNRKGYLVKTWTKMRDRNEALDTRVYNRAAIELLGVARWQPHHWEAQRAKSKPIKDRQSILEQRRNQDPTTKKVRRPKINPADDFW